MSPALSNCCVRQAGLLGNDASHFEDLVGVSPFVVIPGADFDKGLVKLDTGFDVEDGGAGIAAEVGGDDRFVGVTEDAFEFAFGSFLHGSADFFIAGFGVELAGEVNERNVGGRNADGHTGQFAVEFGQNLADSLRSTGGGRNHVFEDSASASPVLLGGTVNGLLGGCGSVDGGHETALDAELVVEDLGDRSKAVRGAGSVGHDLDAGVGLMVDTIDEHRGGVLGRSGHDDFLCAGLDVHAGFGVFEEETGGFDNDVGADFVPLELGRILFRGEADLLAVDDHVVAVDLDVMLEDSVDGVVFQHVREIIRIEKVVDSDNFDVLGEVFHCSAENHASDSSESVDSYFNSHFFPFLIIV